MMCRSRIATAWQTCSFASIVRIFPPNSAVSAGATWPKANDDTSIGTPTNMNLIGMQVPGLNSLRFGLPGHTHCPARQPPTAPRPWARFSVLPLTNSQSLADKLQVGVRRGHPVCRLIFLVDRDRPGEVRGPDQREQFGPVHHALPQRTLHRNPLAI